LKKLFLKLFIFCIVFIILAELVSFIIYNQFLIKNKIKYRQNVNRVYTTFHWYEKNNIGYHPYLTYFDENIKVVKNNLDYFDIAVLGGSFAEGLSRVFSEVNRSCGGRKLKFTNLSLGGYRQPQQLITSILYMDNFDAFISVEGFNESVATSSTCKPLSWNKLSQLYDPKYGSTIYFKSYILLKNVYKNFYLLNKHFYTPRVILYFASKNIKNTFYKLLHKHNKSIEDQCRKETESIIKIDSGDLWYKFLKRQHLLLDSVDKKILTFIQPNQYLKGTKKWSSDEHKIFQSKDKVHQEKINEKYINAISKIKTIKSKNIINLTSVYSDIESTIYKDECCHVNEQGNKVIIKEILRHLDEKVCNERKQ